MKYSEVKNAINDIREMSNKFLIVGMKELQLEGIKVYSMHNKTSINNPNWWGSTMYQNNYISIYYRNILYSCIRICQKEKYKNSFNKILTYIVGTTVLHELRHKWQFKTKYLLEPNVDPQYFYNHIREKKCRN